MDKDNKDRPVTEAQLRYIKKIEELLKISFQGNTLDEASDFIEEHRDRYQITLHTPYKYR
jgi:Ran GTPase-activating protein (RanGAP) involved in mRNA processing and transport